MVMFVCCCMWLCACVLFDLPLQLLPSIAIVFIVLLLLLCGELACGDVCLLF